LKTVAIVVLSGGLDSSTCAYMAKKSGLNIIPVHFNYGQKTLKKELKCFNDICDSLNLPHKDRYEIDLPFFTDVGCSSLTDTNMIVPTSGINSSVPSTYVPFRNGIFLSIASAVAIKHSATQIHIGIVQEDGSGYPDCTKEFITKQQECINEGVKPSQKISLITPLLNKTKKDITLIAIKLKVPIDKTWSCYKNELVACGLCDSCRLRLDGFKKAGLNDSIEYITKVLDT